MTFCLEEPFACPRAAIGLQTTMLGEIHALCAIHVQSLQKIEFPM
jgi:hypothetical protein